VLVDEEWGGIDRDALQQKLHQLNIGTGIHYVAVHLQPYYHQTWGYRRDDFPEAEYISDRTLSLPLGVNMSDGDGEDVVEALGQVLQRGVKSQVHTSASMQI
jgi:dTDP-4-amino-4,6-dideoxygalactose transaminase